MKNVEILGTGVALPRKVIRSEEIDNIQGYKPGFTEQASGVSSRHYAVEESATDLAKWQLKEHFIIENWPKNRNFDFFRTDRRCC